MAQEGAKADLEVTPQMVEAGYRALAAAGLTDEPLEADRLVVVEIYRAMAALAPLAGFRSETT